MGGQCQRAQAINKEPDFRNSYTMQHLVFGEVIRVRGQPTDQAYKRIHYHSIDADEFRRRYEIAKESNQAVATLVQIYECNMLDEHSMKSHNDPVDHQPSTLNCKEDQSPYILLQFQYFQPDDCLLSILHSRLASLQKLKKRLGANTIQNAEEVRLCNYQQIDKLPSQQRQVVNNYFQEIQVLRMIDHIVGALYFLHHYDVEHRAVRPESLLVDHEGKYLLADKQLFLLPTNYQLALEFVRSPQEKKKANINGCFQYIAPQWLPELKDNKEVSNQDGQKGDIFCVGLIALRMCLLTWQKQLFSYSHQLKCLVFHQQNLLELLTQVRTRYSDQFFRLLLQMLKKDPAQRVDFSQLIDQLNPVLLKNLQSIKELHSPACTHSKPMVQSQFIPVAPEKNVLREQLERMEDSFQKVMNKRTLLMHNEASHQTIRQQEQTLIKKLQMLQSTKSKTDRSQSKNQDPNVRTFQLNPQDHSPKETKRYLNGQQLQKIMWREYENLKKGQGIN